CSRMFTPSPHLAIVEGVEGRAVILPHHQHADCNRNQKHQFEAFRKEFPGAIPAGWLTGAQALQLASGIAGAGLWTQRKTLMPSTRDRVATHPVTATLG